MEISEQELARLNFYRVSALEIGLSLGRLVGQVREPWVMLQLTRHSEEELQHARLWTETILALCALPHTTRRGYRERHTLGLGKLRSTLQSLALTHVQELRMHGHFQEHAELPETHPVIRSTLLRIRKAEKAHLAWVRWWLDREVDSRGMDVRQLLERYQELDDAIYRGIREELGFEPDRAREGAQEEAPTGSEP